MSSKPVESFNWGERLALIEHYSPTDETACEALGITQSDLSSARQGLETGEFQIDPNIELSQYSNIFETIKLPPQTTEQVPAQSANPPERRKRGRPGTKVREAFAAVPTDPVPVEEFLSEHEVSLPVLRQPKRFDKDDAGNYRGETLGEVKVKRIRPEGAPADSDKVDMIWREPPNS